MMLNFCTENAIPYKITGKLIVALNKNEEPALLEILRRGKENGLDGLKLIGHDEIKQYEPNAEGYKAIHVPQTGIIDYKEVCIKLAEILEAKGVELNMNEPVTGIKMNGLCEVTTSKGAYSASALAICAGLYTDRLTRKFNPKLNVRIIPFRGEYYKLVPKKSGIVNTLIYPVPDPAFPFLGVHLTKDIHGKVHAGPNAVLAMKREGYKKFSFNPADLADTLSWKGFYTITRKYWRTGFYEQYRSFSKSAFLKSLRKLVPSIEAKDLLPDESGVRAQVCDKNGKLIDDFLFEENEHVVSVLNAPSPAATSSLAIGETVAEKILGKLNRNSGN
jgi:L-2-hydroxyglutarate oxidase